MEITYVNQNKFTFKGLTGLFVLSTGVDLFFGITMTNSSRAWRGTAAIGLYHRNHRISYKRSSVQKE